LQRRLAEEGAEFSELLNSIRRLHATRYLTNPRVSVAEVAGLVGYSQETSFTRWFAGEFGVSPSVWRTAH
jgi:AraC-like DNA-binding protein